MGIPCIVKLGIQWDGFCCLLSKMFDAVVARGDKWILLYDETYRIQIYPRNIMKSTLLEVWT